MSTLFIYNALLSDATQIPIQIHNSNCVKHREKERDGEIVGEQKGSGSRLKLISFETLLLFQAETQYRAGAWSEGGVAYEQEKEKKQRT